MDDHTIIWYTFTYTINSLDGVASQTVSLSVEKNLYFGKVVIVRVDTCVHKVISITKKK